MTTASCMAELKAMLPRVGRFVDHLAAALPEYADVMDAALCVYCMHAAPLDSTVAFSRFMCLDPAFMDALPPQWRAADLLRFASALRSTAVHGASAAGGQSARSSRPAAFCRNVCDVQTACGCRGGPLAPA